MKEQKQKCKDCNKEFKQKSTSRFPRKYCEKCSAQRKKEYQYFIDLLFYNNCEGVSNEKNSDICRKF